MKYEILGGATTQSLVEIVNSYLKQGWNLQGGVSAVQRSSGSWFFTQAMWKDDTRKVKNPPPPKHDTGGVR